jgi:hypothetical protein
LLTNNLAVPFLEALALEGGIMPSTSVNPAALAHAIGRSSTWFGAIRSGEVWYEQASQWNRLRGDETDRERTVREYWDHHNRLMRHTSWLEGQCAHWRSLVEQHEATLKDRGRWSDRLDQQKASAQG